MNTIVHGSFVTRRGDCYGRDGGLKPGLVTRLSAGHSRSSSSYSGLATVADVESREEPGVGLELVISGASMLKEGTGMLESFFASDAAALACAAGTFA